MFLDVCKAFDTVWIDGLMHRLLPELGVQGKMFSAIKSWCFDIQYISMEPLLVLFL